MDNSVSEGVSDGRPDSARELLEEVAGDARLREAQAYRPSSDDEGGGVAGALKDTGASPGVRHTSSHSGDAGQPGSGMPGISKATYTATEPSDAGAARNMGSEAGATAGGIPSQHRDTAPSNQQGGPSQARPLSPVRLATNGVKPLGRTAIPSRFQGQTAALRGIPYGVPFAANPQSEGQRSDSAGPSQAGAQTSQGVSPLGTGGRHLQDQQQAPQPQRPRGDAEQQHGQQPQHAEPPRAAPPASAKSQAGPSSQQPEGEASAGHRPQQTRPHTGPVDGAAEAPPPNRTETEEPGSSQGRADTSRPETRSAPHNSDAGQDVAGAAGPAARSNTEAAQHQGVAPQGAADAPIGAPRSPSGLGAPGAQPQVWITKIDTGCTYLRKEVVPILVPEHLGLAATGSRDPGAKSPYVTVQTHYHNPKVPSGLAAVPARLWIYRECDWQLTWSTDALQELQSCCGQHVAMWRDPEGRIRIARHDTGTAAAQAGESAPGAAREPAAGAGREAADGGARRGSRWGNSRDADPQAGAARAEGESGDEVRSSADDSTGRSGEDDDPEGGFGGSGSDGGGRQGGSSGDEAESGSSDSTDDEDGGPGAEGGEGAPGVRRTVGRRLTRSRPRGQQDRRPHAAAGAAACAGGRRRRSSGHGGPHAAALTKQQRAHGKVLSHSEVARHRFTTRAPMTAPGGVFRGLALQQYEGCLELLEAAPDGAAGGRVWKVEVVPANHGKGSFRLNGVRQMYNDLGARQGDLLLFEVVSLTKYKVRLHAAPRPDAAGEAGGVAVRPRGVAPTASGDSGDDASKEESEEDSEQDDGGASSEDAAYDGESDGNSDEAGPSGRGTRGRRGGGSAGRRGDRAAAKRRCSGATGRGSGVRVEIRVTLTRSDIEKNAVQPPKEDAVKMFGHIKKRHDKERPDTSQDIPLNVVDEHSGDGRRIAGQQPPVLRVYSAAQWRVKHLKGWLLEHGAKQGDVLRIWRGQSGSSSSVFRVSVLPAGAEGDGGGSAAAGPAPKPQARRRRASAAAAQAAGASEDRASDGAAGASADDADDGESEEGADDGGSEDHEEDWVAAEEGEGGESEDGGAGDAADGDAAGGGHGAEPHGQAGWRPTHAKRLAVTDVNKGRMVLPMKMVTGDGVFAPLMSPDRYQGPITLIPEDDHSRRFEVQVASYATQKNNAELNRVRQCYNAQLNGVGGVLKHFGVGPDCQEEVVLSFRRDARDDTHKTYFVQRLQSSHGAAGQPASAAAAAPAAGKQVQPDGAAQQRRSRGAGAAGGVPEAAPAAAGQQAAPASVGARKQHVQPVPNAAGPEATAGVHGQPPQLHPAPSITHLEGCLPPGAAPPAVRDGEMRRAGQTFSRDAAAAVEKTMADWAARAGKPLASLSILDQITIPGISGGAEVPGVAAGPWRELFIRPDLDGSIVCLGVANLLGLRSDRPGGWGAELPERPLPPANVELRQDRQRGGVGVFAARALKVNSVIGILEGYVTAEAPDGKDFLERGFEGLQGSVRREFAARCQAAVRPGAGPAGAEPCVPWQFLAGSLRVPYVGHASTAPAAYAGLPPLELHMLGYGNALAHVNDPRVSPWGQRHADDDRAAMEAANCLVVPVCVRGLVLLVLVALRDIAPGEQLLRDYGPDWWRHMRSKWRALNHADMEDFAILHSRSALEQYPPAPAPSAAPAAGAPLGSGAAAGPSGAGAGDAQGRHERRDDGYARGSHRKHGRRQSRSRSRSRSRGRKRSRRDRKKRRRRSSSSSRSSSRSSRSGCSSSASEDTSRDSGDGSSSGSEGSGSAGRKDGGQKRRRHSGGRKRREGDKKRNHSHSHHKKTRRDGGEP